MLSLNSRIYHLRSKTLLEYYCSLQICVADYFLFSSESDIITIRISFVQLFWIITTSEIVGAKCFKGTLISASMHPRPWPVLGCLGQVLAMRKYFNVFQRQAQFQKKTIIPWLLPTLLSFQRHFHEKEDSILSARSNWTCSIRQYKST